MAKSHFTRIVAVLFLVVSFQAKAEFFGEVGVSFYERPSGSLWQQAFAGYWTDWDTRPPMFRVGYDFNGIRLSYFDLGKYGISAMAGNDEGAIDACRCIVGGEEHMYYTTGSMRGVALSYKHDLGFVPVGFMKYMFVEAGVTRVRASLKIEKDDGFKFNETAYGYGHIIGIGVEYENLHIGWYGYRTKIGGSFNDGATPSGTGGANELVFGYSF